MKTIDFIKLTDAMTENLYEEVKNDIRVFLCEYTYTPEGKEIYDNIDFSQVIELRNKLTGYYGRGYEDIRFIASNVLGAVISVLNAIHVSNRG